MTLCFFAFAMVMGTQTMVAQNTIEINSLAAKKTQELKKVIKFNTDTEDLIYKTYQNYEQKKYDIEKLKAQGKTVSQNDMKKFENFLPEQFRTIFTEEEFQRYIAYTNNQK